MMRRPGALVVLAAVLMLAACSLGTAGGQPGQSPSTDAGGVAPGGGDIPDNQVYLGYTGAGFTLQYPEGWVQAARSDGVTFQDKDNRISVTIQSGDAPSVESVRAEVRAIAGATLTGDAHAITLPGGTAILATYQIDGPADPVTAKRPRLTIDRYELSQSGRRAILDLASPVGADNVDAYRMIAQSFRWR
jgi:hypothetical protein